MIDLKLGAELRYILLRDDKNYIMICLHKCNRNYKFSNKFDAGVTCKYFACTPCGQAFTMINDIRYIYDEWLNFHDGKICFLFYALLCKELQPVPAFSL